VVIHAIAVRDAPADIRAFLDRHGDPFRRIALDPKGDMRRAFGASGLPETYLIDGEGVIRYRHIGDIRPEHVPDLLARIDAARGS
jgi:cytochrome c biogenesis protein CcmG/thiol:disulfide interchange protein DsbE